MEDSSAKPSRIAMAKKTLVHALEAFTPLERMAFIASLAIAAIAALVLIYRINEQFLVSVPTSGGTLNEGVIGTPRFVNPLLATSEADEDLTALVYRGLMKKDANGDIVPDLATSYTVSPDGLTYTFTLGNAEFQDGVPITSADVVFTVQSAQDAMLKSAEQVAWEGVIASAPDAKTVVFTLKQPFAPFLASTTLGILPKHVWSTIPYENWSTSDHNTTDVVGDGLYKVHSVKQDSSGVPLYYDLTAIRAKDSNLPRIDTVRMHFYASEAALVAAYQSGAVDAIGGIDPADAAALAKSGGTHILTAQLPRVFGLFFNPSQADIFADPAVRQAIGLAIDKGSIVANVLSGYGTTDQGPIPASSPLAAGSESATVPDPGNVAAAKALLEKDGWSLNASGVYQKVISKKETDTLSFEIATNDTPELTEAANSISNDLAAAGIQATPKVYETGSLNEDIIRPRKFQALFFGEVVSSQSDLYAFWDSSQRNDPGLNITGYANSNVDKLLVSGLATLDPAKEAAIYASVEADIEADAPAVFVYSPAYIYAVRGDMTGITIGQVSTPSDRFANIGSWYITTDRVWPAFAKKQ